jgi:hypothetical protein
MNNAIAENKIPIHGQPKTTAAPANAAGIAI